MRLGMGAVTILACLISACMVWSTVGQGTSRCYASLNFTSQRGGLYVNDNPFALKGLSWFGFETGNKVVHGLWSRSYTALLDFVKSNNFNAMRLPFHLELALNDGQPNSINYDLNSDLRGLSSLQVMDKIIKAAGERGILVMLDLHSFRPDSFMSDGMWFSSEYPEAKVLSGWTKLADRYKGQWNVFAADLKNEPHQATWGTGNAGTDWNLAAARLGNTIHQTASDWLIFVEGTSFSPSTRDNCFWGENLSGVRNNPVALGQTNKLVYSPHVYGPNVFGQSYFSAPNFPANMPAIWEDHFGYVPGHSGRAIVIGEWGGPYRGQDSVWMNALVDYLINKRSTDQFFWCLNPNSGDTGGLLDNDWTTPVTTKLDMLKRLSPNPTRFSADGQQFCVTVGGGSNDVPPSSSPAAPRPSASSSPAAPRPSASSSPAAPRPSASSSPAAPRPSASSSPAAPRPSASASPTALRPSAASPMPADPSASPAAPPPNDCTCDIPSSNIEWQGGANTWWLGVLIPDSQSVKVNCNNGQGWQDMEPGWAPGIWTFTAALQCDRTVQFIVNDGPAQVLVLPATAS